MTAPAARPDSPVSIVSILALALPSGAVFLLASLVGIFMIRIAATLGPDAVVAVNADGIAISSAPRWTSRTMRSGPAGRASK